MCARTLVQAVSQGNRDAGLLGLLRTAALIAVLVGAVGSVGLMLRVGQRQRSVILLVLFTIWVLSPFVALIALASMGSTRWPVLTRATLYSVMLIVTLGSLAVYGDVAFGPPRAKPASFFLMVPLISWLLIAVHFAITAVISGRLSRRPKLPLP